MDCWSNFQASWSPVEEVQECREAWMLRLSWKGLSTRGSQEEQEEVGEGEASPAGCLHLGLVLQIWGGIELVVGSPLLGQ